MVKSFKTHKVKFAQNYCFKTAFQCTLTYFGKNAAIQKLTVNAVSI